MSYRVFVAENNPQTDVETIILERHFDNYWSAVAKCKAIVSDWFSDEIASGRLITDIETRYQQLGPMPYVVPRVEGVSEFSPKLFARSVYERLQTRSN